jgi:hypothetical protein|tara:strand:+ start:1829 stop:1987 length:159 start_codon:yes stop_codon:yes gene_type:complete
MKNSKKHKKLVVIESKNEKKLLSFMSVMKVVAKDMGLKVTDGAMHSLMGSDY